MSANSKNLYDFEMPRNNGEVEHLSAYKGQVVLVVNTASKCGFTPQYDGLQNLYDQYKAQGFAVLAFPCDQFGHQEPGDDAQIQEFCSLNFNVNFPLFKKIEVNGQGTAPVYEYLKNAAPGLLGSKAIKWNFTKFLVDTNGNVVKRYGPNTKPEAIKGDIEALLKN